MNPLSLFRPARAEEHVTASPRGAPWWGGLSRNTARFLAGNSAAPRTTALLAGAVLLAGVISGHADTQTVVVPAYSDAYVTCQVDGPNGNKIGDADFLKFPNGLPVATQLLYRVSDCTGTRAPDQVVEWDGAAWIDTTTFEDVSWVQSWNRDETIAVRNNSAAPMKLTLDGTPLLQPVPKTLAPDCFTLLGSQVLDSEVFENITGHPAADYLLVEVHRYVQGMQNPPFSLSATYSKGAWSPAFPDLMAGEAVFIKVFAPATAFPAHGIACSSPKVTFVGSAFIGFDAGDHEVEFKTQSEQRITGQSVEFLAPYQVSATFDLSSTTPGEWLDLVVTINSTETTIKDVFQVDPLTIGAVTPNAAANCGSATLTFVGTGFCPGATVKLRRNADEIVGTGVVPNSDGTTLTATFDLTTAAPGTDWDAVVVQSNISVPYSSALSVESVVPAGIDVLILGPSKIGANSKRGFRVAYRNTGNCAPAAPVTINLTGIPESVRLTDVSGPGTPQNIEGGFRFTPLSVSPSAHYAYLYFALQPKEGEDFPDFPYDVTLTAESTAPYPDTAAVKIQAVASYDPNDKFGHSGVGANHYITGSEVLPYEIHFENKPDASAPAQQVFVTDQLDAAKLNLDTFSLGAITFGTRTIHPPPGLKDFTTAELFDVDGNPIIVRIAAKLEANGLFTCSFLSFDPLTGQLPEDPEHGFLPPNGEGSVHFTIKARPGLADGTVIANGASIVFDTNPVIITPKWSNTLDLSPPVSAVDELPAFSPTTFAVFWEGHDSGSGIASYDIWVSDNGGDPTLWLGNTTATEGSFSGSIGHTYEFYSVARDALGNTEDAPATPDASTTVSNCAPYEIWISGYGLTGADALMDADPDHDGANNLIEFATSGNPTSGASGPRCYPLLHVIGGDSVLTFTLAVRQGAVFAPAAPPHQMQQTATVDCVVYTVEGSANLAAWDIIVTEVTGADATAVQSALGAKLAVPPLGADWHWHTFRTAGHAGEKPAAFIRVKVRLE